MPVSNGSTFEPQAGQRAHLRMLARVLTKSVRQGSYLLEGPQYGTPDTTAAKVAAGLDAVSQTQFTCSAEGTDCGVRSGG